MRRPGGIIKGFLPRTLFGRALLILVTPLVLVQLILTWIFYDRHWETVSKRLANAVAGEIGLLIHNLHRHPDPADRADAFAAVADKTDMRAALKIGQRLAPTPPPVGDGILERRLKRALEIRVDRPFHMDTDERGPDILIEVQLPEGVLEVLVPRQRLFSSTTYALILWMLGSSAVLLTVAGIFMRNQVRPIRQLAAAADAFGKGREAPDFRIAGAAEVRQAAMAFTLMRDRIQRQITQRTEMLAGVSHDLRTPLTRMKLELAMFENREVAEGLRHDVDEMERMLEGYLAFARGEGGEAMVVCDIATLLDEVIDELRRSGARVARDEVVSLRIPVRRNALKRCLANILTNAVEHARHVRVSARRSGDSVEIVVDDDGPGIPAAERENVFRPFYRLDNSRNPATGGVGLGLSIARDVARGHGGDVTLLDSPRGGLRVLVRVPL